MLGDFDAVATIAVRNLQAARKFYEGKLGFKVVHNEGDQALTFQSGGRRTASSLRKPLRAPA